MALGFVWVWGPTYLTRSRLYKRATMGLALLTLLGGLYVLWPSAGHSAHRHRMVSHKSSPSRSLRYYGCMETTDMVRRASLEAASLHICSRVCPAADFVGVRLQRHCECANQSDMRHARPVPGMTAMQCQDLSTAIMVHTRLASEQRLGPVPTVHVMIASEGRGLLGTQALIKSVVSNTAGAVHFHVVTLVASVPQLEKFRSCHPQLHISILPFNVSWVQGRILVRSTRPRLASPVPKKRSR